MQTTTGVLFPWTLHGPSKGRFVFWGSFRLSFPFLQNTSLNQLNSKEQVFGHCGTLLVSWTLLDLHGHQNWPLNGPREADFEKVSSSNNLDNTHEFTAWFDVNPTLGLTKIIMFIPVWHTYPDPSSVCYILLSSIINIHQCITISINF